METSSDDRIIAAVRAVRDDRVIASVRAARDAYAARHGYDVGAIFEDIRALQEASGRTYVRHVEPLAEASAPYLAEWSALTARLAEWSRIVNAMNEVGWLPYHTAPFHHVDECGDDLDLLDRRFSDYYRTQWSEIRDDMESRLVAYHIDDEARETFREALSAHEAGLYRCVCRVLFPEIERTIGRLVKHVYESGTRESFERDPVPNRQAAMHGLASYSTHKHSVNMLILTDCIFQILPPLEDSDT